MINIDRYDFDVDECIKKGWVVRRNKGKYCLYSDVEKLIYSIEERITGMPHSDEDEQYGLNMKEGEK